jgi:hypothetical protein
MKFDAAAARALSQRTHSVQDCLAALKKAVVEAAQLGEYETVIGLPEAIPIGAGESSNTAGFLIDFLAGRGFHVWSESVRHALAAGYTVRPSWRSVTSGAALDGLLLSWHLVEPDGTAVGDLLLMSAEIARDMSRVEQVHHRWVERLKDTVRKAALRGQQSVTVHEATPAADAAWRKRCEILQHAGFGTDLLASDNGATLVIRW